MVSITQKTAATVSSLITGKNGQTYQPISPAGSDVEDCTQHAATADRITSPKKAKAARKALFIVLIVLAFLLLIVSSLMYAPYLLSLLHISLLSKGFVGHMTWALLVS